MTRILFRTAYQSQNNHDWENGPVIEKEENARKIFDLLSESMPEGWELAIEMNLTLVYRGVIRHQVKA